MEKFLAVETLVIALLLVVSLVAIAVRRLRIPYTVALVLAGFPITFQQRLDISLTPELILSIFVPPLIFEASFHIDFKSLRENWLPILGLAVPGVLITTFIVGLITAFGVRMPLSSALVFGALIAATDPVAVVALFRAIGAPKRLTMLLESESLFNDGTAIVIFQIVMAIALSAGALGVSEFGSFDALSAIVNFFRVAAGGLAIGFGLGWVIAQILARIDDYLIETTLTTVLAFGSYLVAEQFHVSGVLAVVAAGIVTGNIGFKKMSPTTKIVLFNFWEYLAFVANSLVFLLIGLDTNLREIFGNLLPIGIALLAILISRAIVVYGIVALTNLRGTKVPFAYQQVLFWGGLRGAISLALVLSLPAAFAEREQLRVMTFGVVLFTLLVQGTTMRFLLQRLGLLQQPNPLELEYEKRHGRLLAAQSSLKRVEEMHREGLISVATWEQIEPTAKEQLKDLIEAQRQLLQAYPELQSEEHEDAQLEGLRAQRAALSTMLSDGIISDSVYEELVAEVDAALTRSNQAVSELQKKSR
ncbi:MAG: Na+/H+ antiporter [Pyrinomonadaceae bacterium]